MTATLSGARQLDGLAVDVYTANSSVPIADAPAQLDLAALARLNGARLPLGVKAPAGTNSMPVQYLVAQREIFTVVKDTAAVIDLRWQQTVTVLARSAVGTIPVNAGTTSTGFSSAAADGALKTADRSRPGGFDQRPVRSAEQPAGRLSQWR